MGSGLFSMESLEVVDLDCDILWRRGPLLLFKGNGSLERCRYQL